MANLNHVSWTASAFLLVTCSVGVATGAEPPADLCSLLPEAVVSKTLGQNFGPPKKAGAHQPYANTAEGNINNWIRRQCGTDRSNLALQETM